MTKKKPADKADKADKAAPKVCPYSCVDIYFSEFDFISIEDPISVIFTEPQYIIKVKGFTHVMPHTYRNIVFHEK